MKYKEIKTKCRSFLHETEPEVIHIHKIREDEYMVVHEDAMDECTGKIELFNEKDLEEKYGRILVKFKKGDKVELSNELLEAYGFDTGTDQFFVVDVLSREYPYNIVVGNNQYGTDWKEFFMEDELTLIEE